MSDASDTTTAAGGELAPRGDDRGGLDKASRKVLVILPADYRRAVGWLWMMNSHLMPTPLPLAMRFQYWIERHDLTLAECREVVAGISTPAAQARHNFANQFLAELAGDVDAVVKRRKARDRAEAAALKYDAEYGRKPAATQAEIVAAMQQHHWARPVDDDRDAGVVSSPDNPTGGG